MLFRSHTQLVYASKDAAGNPKSTEAHARVDQASDLTQDAVADLTQLLEKAGGEAGLISGRGGEGRKGEGKTRSEERRRGRGLGVVISFDTCTVTPNMHLTLGLPVHVHDIMCILSYQYIEGYFTDCTCIRVQSYT